jgi:hypothetical protein
VQEGGYEEGEDTCAGRGAVGITIGCQGIVSLPDIAHELGIATKPSHILYMHIEHRVVTSKPVVPEIRKRGEAYLCMISIASTLIHPAEAHQSQTCLQ